MSKATSILLKAFNKHIFEFLKDIQSIFPENTEIKNSIDYLETLKTANPSLMIKIWYKFIYSPYSEHIDNGNIDFFLEKDYSQDLSNLPQSDKILEVIDSSLREPLKKMDGENKAKCIKHIQLISTISLKYTEEKK